MSAPPKQMLVTPRSGIGWLCTRAPVGSISMTAPACKAATQILPLALSARLSNRAWPPTPAIRVPPAGEGQGRLRTWPGPGPRPGDLPGPQARGLRLCHIQRLAVRRQADAIGREQRPDDLADLAAIGA